MGQADALLNAARSGELAISDAFPFVGSELYLPKPFMHMSGLFPDGTEGAKEIDSLTRKANKKLSFVPVKRYGKYLKGTLDAQEELDLFRLGESSTQTKVNLTRSHKPDADPYHVGSFSFYSGSGLYFILCGSYDIGPILEQMRYSGLGGKRSSGYGRFDCSIERFETPYTLTTMRDGECETRVSDTAPKHVLLSTALPAKDELTDELLEGSSYKVVRKGGFVQSGTHSVRPQKKRDLYPFAAGSLFARRFAGDVFDVNATPGAHPVYRYARAMWMEV